METYKTKGLDYYVVNVENEYQAATIFIKNRIGVMPSDLEIFEGDVPETAIVFNVKN